MLVVDLLLAAGGFVQVLRALWLSFGTKKNRRQSEFWQPLPLVGQKNLAIGISTSCIERSRTDLGIYSLF